MRIISIVLYAIFVVKMKNSRVATA